MDGILKYLQDMKQYNIELLICIVIYNISLLENKQKQMSITDIPL